MVDETNKVLRNIAVYISLIALNLGVFSCATLQGLRRIDEKLGYISRNISHCTDRLGRKYEEAHRLQATRRDVLEGPEPEEFYDIHGINAYTKIDDKPIDPKTPGEFYIVNGERAYTMIKGKYVDLLFYKKLPEEEGIPIPYRKEELIP